MSRHLLEGLAHTAVILFVTLLTACGEGRSGSRQETDARPDSAIGNVAGTANEPADVHLSPEWRVSFRGVGPLVVGMDLTAASKALGLELRPPDSASASCDYITIDTGSVKVLVMVVDQKMARFDVRDASIATDRGARVGDSERRIDSLYAGLVKRMPHKYTEGSYLIVTPPSSADSMIRLLFESDGHVVTQYRIGRMPEVEWVEGCS
jgi:hypothetical protein